MKFLYVLLIAFISYSTALLAQEKFITIGNGGGIAGTATIYKITSSGEVFRGKGIGEIKYTECAKIKKAKAQMYLQKASEQTQSNSQISHPGNMYYFLGYVEGANERKITWGDANHPVPESIQKLYQEINTSIGSARFKPIK